MPSRRTSANLGNVAFAQQVAGRQYAGLTMVSQIYGGGTSE
jgi:hypothetical protein